MQHWSSEIELKTNHGRKGRGREIPFVAGAPQERLFDTASHSPSASLRASAHQPAQDDRGAALYLAIFTRDYHDDILSLKLALLGRCPERNRRSLTRRSGAQPRKGVC